MHNVRREYHLIPLTLLMRYHFLEVQNLKAFLKIRDNSPVFDDVRMNGYVGIPCFVMEDGAVTITPEEVGLRSEPVQDGQACKLDGTGC